MPNNINLKKKLFNKMILCTNPFDFDTDYCFKNHIFFIDQSNVYGMDQWDVLLILDGLVFDFF